MQLSLSPEEQLSAELRHRYLKLCGRYGKAAVRPPTEQLVEAFRRVTEGSATQGPAAVLATVQASGDAYEFMVGRTCDPVWRGLVRLAFEMGLPNEDGARNGPRPAAAPVSLFGTPGASGQVA